MVTTLMVPNLQISARSGVSNAEVETCFPFRHEMDSGTPLLGVGHDLRLDGGSSKLVLLRTTPPIGMGQHELNVVRNRVPAIFSDLIGRNKHRFRRIKEISHEIGKHVDDSFSLRKVLAHLIPQDFGRFFGSEHKLPPVTVSGGEMEYL